MLSTRSFAMPSAVVVSLALGLAGCTGLNGTGLTGDASAGQAIYQQKCSPCHATSFLVPRAGLIPNNLGSRMNNITLTDQDIADLQAFLATQ